MTDENVKAVIKTEYENGTSMSVLAKKYSINISSIKKWSSEEKWIKKKQNRITKKGITKTEKDNQNKSVIENQEMKIKKQIIEDTPRDEVMKNFDISYPTYYRKKKEILELMQERSKALFDDINKEVFHDIEELLKSLTLGKRNLVSKIINEISKSIKEKREIDLKKVTDNKSVFDILEKLIKSLLSSGGFLTREQINEEMSDLMKQENILKEQEIKMEYLEIEKIKNGVADDNDNKIEIELIEV